MTRPSSSNRSTIPLSTSTTMEGHFDFPPASDQTSPIGHLTARFDGLRQELTSTLNAELASRTPNENPSSASTTRPGLPLPPIMPRPRRRAGSGTQASSRRYSGPREESRMGMGDRRPRAERPSFRRARADIQNESFHLREELRLRQAQLERAESHLTGVEASLGMSRNSRGEHDTTPEDNASRGAPFAAQAMELLSANRRLSKRRKLDHERDENIGFPLFSYGYEGQTVPGLLKMEIVGCDGGEYSSYALDNASLRSQLGFARTDVGRHENYRAENVLRDDRSVYCTKSKRCNLMLRHKGEALFHLESVVIKSPELGYTAPLQQGLVFVGMESGKLSAGTSTYHIAYDPPPPGEPSSQSAIYPSSHPPPDPGSSRRAAPSSTERLPLIEALHDPSIWEASRQSQNRNRATLPRPAGMRRHPVDTLLAILGDDEEAISAHRDAYGEVCDWPEQDSTRDQTQADFVHSDYSRTDSDQERSGSGRSELTTAPTPPPFTVTWESEEDDDVDEDGPYPNRRLPPLERREASTSDDDGSDALARLYHGGMIRRPTRRSSPGRIELRDGGGEVRSGAADVESGVEIIKPHARFFIGEKRSKITIKFDPPVSGRFLLLKLFSPELHDGENIDIQYVAAYGFAGPRFFPSVEMK